MEEVQTNCEKFRLRLLMERSLQVPQSLRKLGRK